MSVWVDPELGCPALSALLNHCAGDCIEDEGRAGAVIREAIYAYVEATGQKSGWAYEFYNDATDEMKKRHFIAKSSSVIISATVILASKKTTPERRLIFL